MLPILLSLRDMLLMLNMSPLHVYIRCFLLLLLSRAYAAAAFSPARLRFRADAALCLMLRCHTPAAAMLGHAAAPCR